MSEVGESSRADAKDALIEQLRLALDDLYCYTFTRTPGHFYNGALTLERHRALNGATAALDAARVLKAEFGR